MTTWPDVSEHNGKPVDPQLRSRWVAFRANDGTYQDHLFSVNYERSRNLVRTRRLVGFIVYTVWPRSVGFSSWRDSVGTLVTMLGRSYQPRMVIMMDIESWGRHELSRNRTIDLEEMRRFLVQYLFSTRPAWQRRPPFKSYYRSKDNRRVIGYGNRGDLLTMASGVKWRSVILADYSGNPTPKTIGRWHVIGRQFTSDGHAEPWGHPIDLNRSAYTDVTLGRAMGVGALTPRKTRHH